MKRIIDDPYFLEMANQGKNSWWRFLLSVFVVVASFLLGALVIGFIAIYINNGVRPAGSMTGFILNLPNVYFRTIILNIDYILAFTALVLVVKYIHKRKFLTLISSSAKLNWKKIVTGAFVFFVFYVIVELLFTMYSNNTFQFELQPGKFFPLAFISLLIVPIQTSFEELFHRGYMFQMLSRYLKYPLISLLISSLIFGLFHIQSSELIIFFSVTGFFLGLITIVSNSLEMAIGIHAVNNLFFLFVSSTNDGTALFFHQENPKNVLIWLTPLVLTFLFCLYKYGTGNLKLLIVKTSSEKVV
jgi:membrane protease YdiL (CAAX protease family)